MRLSALPAVELAELERLAVEILDARERERGGKWRQAQTLLPGEEVIEDARLS